MKRNSYFTAYQVTFFFFLLLRDWQPLVRWPTRAITLIGSSDTANSPQREEVSDLRESDGEEVSDFPSKIGGVSDLCPTKAINRILPKYEINFFSNVNFFSSI